MKNLLFNFGILSATLSLGILNLASATNYCDPALCTTNYEVRPHIGCENDGKFFKVCIEPSEIQITPHLKQVILHAHNDLRNKVANGSLPGFQSAKRMTTMTWDSELAYLAGLNVRTCEMVHDECHNTEAYRYSGQNIGIQHQTSPLYPPEYESIIVFLINEWFNEYKYANQHDVDKCVRIFHRNEIGHFTALIQEKSAKVGCGIVRFVKYMLGENWDTLLLACNYSFGNVVDMPIYVKGPMCSACQTGCNPEYNGLCSVFENVSPFADPDEDPYSFYPVSPLLTLQSGRYIQPGSSTQSVRRIPAGRPLRPVYSGLPPRPVQSVQAARPVPTVQVTRPVTPVQATRPDIPIQSSEPIASSPDYQPVSSGTEHRPDLSGYSIQPVPEMTENLQMNQPIQPTLTSRFMDLLRVAESIILPFEIRKASEQPQPPVRTNDAQPFEIWDEPKSGENRFQCPFKSFTRF